MIELMEAIAEAVVEGFNIVFFLGGEYDMAQHILSVRANETEIAMMASRWHPNRAIGPHEVVPDRIERDHVSNFFECAMGASSL